MWVIAAVIIAILLAGLIYLIRLDGHFHIKGYGQLLQAKKMAGRETSHNVVIDNYNQRRTS